MCFGFEYILGWVNSVFLRSFLRERRLVWLIGHGHAVSCFFYDGQDLF